METIEIQGERRVDLGRWASRRLRASKRVPGVLYGRERSAPVHFSLPQNAVDGLLRTGVRLVRLALEDGSREAGLLREVQVDPVTDQVLHIDLVHVDLTIEVQVTVRIEILGHAKGVVAGGKFIQQLADLPVRCLPGSIPASVAVRVADMEIGQQILAGQIPLPEGVHLDIPGETLVCQVKAFVEAAEPSAEEPGPSEPEVIGKKETGDEAEE